MAREPLCPGMQAPGDNVMVIHCMFNVNRAAAAQSAAVQPLQCMQYTYKHRSHVWMIFYVHCSVVDKIISIHVFGFTHMARVTGTSGLWETVESMRIDHLARDGGCHLNNLPVLVG